MKEVKKKKMSEQQTFATVWRIVENRCATNKNDRAQSVKNEKYEISSNIFFCSFVRWIVSFAPRLDGGIERATFRASCNRHLFIY